MGPFTIRASVRPARFWVGFVVMSTVSCLLTTPLEGLVGPPLSTDDGGITDGGVPGDDGETDSSRADVSDVDVDSGNADRGSDDGGHIDTPILDGDGGSLGPIVIARVRGVPRGIAEYGAYVYWVQTEFNTGIARILKDGTTSMSEFVDMTANAFDVGVDDEYLYWSTGTNGEVYRKSIVQGGSSGAFYFSGAAGAFYLAMGPGGRIYLTGLNVVAVGPRPDAGISDALYAMQAGAAGIAMYGDQLFWSTDMGIVRGSERGQGADPSRPVYSGMPGEVSGIATDGQDVYWIGSDGAVRAISRVPNAMAREVCRASTETSDAESDARPDGDGGNPTRADVAVDEQWVYFTEPAVQQISKCRKR
jgi:hypothetical protein